ncbi:hypothetical protein HK096_005098 [Nowakowskiella sp. JEL0078]|nr:hypothetical protein HK096_005098 [Nowakowskiella sp. JEL0078]
MATVEELAAKNIRALTLDSNTPGLYSKVMWKNWFPVLAAILALVACGFDQSISWNLPNLPSFTDEITGVDPIQLATFQSLTDFAGMIAAIFMPFFYDFRGRKFAFFWGSIITIIFAVVSVVGTVFADKSAHVAWYYVGRFFTVLGIDLTAGCTWMYASEISHPAHRAFFGGLFGLAWGIGNLINNLVIFGMAFTPKNSWQWRIPTLLQAVFSVALLAMLPFLPESPRTLISKGKRDEAKKVVKEWVGCNVADDKFVEDQMAELDEAFANSVSTKSLFDVYNMKPLWATANSRRRVFYFILTNAGFTLLNWGASGGVFETLIYNLVGLGDPKVKTGINTATQVISLVSSYIACMYIEKWGRRRTYLVSYALSFVLGFFGVAAMEGFAATSSQTYAGLFIFSIFIGQIYASAIGPVKLLFESELLAYDYRAKGKALNDFTGKPANIVMNYIQGAVFAAVSFRSFWIAQGYNLFLLVVYYFIMPETKGRTLEEVDEVFDYPSPFHTLIKPQDGPNYVKHSLEVLKSADLLKAGSKDVETLLKE